MPLVLRPPTDTKPPLTERLAELGQTRRRVLIARGVFRLLAAALALVALACLLDVAFGLHAVARAFLLVMLLGVVTITYVRGVRRYAAESTSPLAVALMLEDRYPALNDSLASAVDFLQKDDEQPIRHNRFRQVTIIRAENLTKKIDLDGLIPSGSAWRAFWLLFFVATVALGLTLLKPSHASLTLQRLFDPFGLHPWPTQTQLSLLNPQSFPARLAKGEAFDLEFRLQGVIPSQGTLRLRLAGNPEQVESFALSNPGQLRDLKHTLKLDATRVPKDFQFQLQVHDAETPWYQVLVSPPPRLVPLDGRPSPQMSLSFPAYTELPPIELTDGSAVIDGPSGTRVRFRALADRRISQAAFQLQGDHQAVHAALSVAMVASDKPLTVLGQTLLAESYLRDIPVSVVGPEGTLLEAEFTPALPGLYALKMADDYGLTGVRLFDFRIVPDPAPVVVLERPAPGKDSLTLVPTATLNLAVHAEDRPFAVRGVNLEYRLGTPESPWQHFPLIDLQQFGPASAALAGTAVVSPQPKPLSWDVFRKIPLTVFRTVNGKPPADGDVLTLRAAAFDWDDRTALKAPGRSREVEIRILNKSSLEALFQKELAALRPELLRQKEDQRQAREKTEEVLNRAKQGAAKPEDLTKLAQAEQEQKQLRAKVADPAEGLRARVDQLRQTAKANELPRSPVIDKIENATAELNRIVDQNLEAAEPLLSGAKQNAESRDAQGQPNADLKKLQADLAKAVREQKAVEEGLAALLERLEEWGGAGEVRGEARALKDQLQRAGNQADKAAEKVPPGKAAKDLNPTERAELASPADKLEEAAQAAEKLLDKANRLARQKEAQAQADQAEAEAKQAEAQKLREQAPEAPAGSPRRAETLAKADALENEAEAKQASAAKAAAEAKALREAVQRAGGQTLAEDIKRAAQSTRANNPGQSSEARESATQKLDQLTESLGEQPTPDVDQLQKKRNKLTDQLEKLSQEQDELRKKVKQAAKIDDETKREEELQKLSREQEQLQRKADELVQKLTREQLNKPAEQLRRASQQMQDAKEQLDRGQAPTPQQEEALDRLDEALQKLDQEKKEDEEKLSTEKREQLMEQLKQSREKQVAAMEEAKRLHAAAAKAKQWSRAQLASLGDLHDREKNLAEELNSFREKNLTELPVFGKLVKQSADSMIRAARLVEERKQDAPRNESEFDAEVEQLADERVLKPMQTALRKLDQILDSLKDDPKKKEAQADGAAPMEGGGNPGGGGGGNQAGGVPPLAQLKALRAMQADVNARTAEFAKKHPDTSQLTEEEREELQELEQAQRDVAELFEKLTPLLRPSADIPEGL